MKRLLFAALLILAACDTNDPAASAWQKPASVTLGCEDYQQITLAQGILYNNVWNKHADTTGTGTQCLESREIDGAMEYGWSWDWPRGKRVIYGYPQIKTGTSPWAPNPDFDPRFPAKIASLKEMTLTFATETSTDGIHNLAASMWLTTEPMIATEPDASVIATEIMIWTYATKGHFNPAGKKVAEISLDEHTWEVWADKNWTDASGINDNTWTYLTFRAKEHSLSAHIDLLKLLDYAADKQFISRDLYIADLELGNEIMSGSGVTWVKEFSLVMN